MTPVIINKYIDDSNIQQAILSNVTIMNLLTDDIKNLEKSVLEQIELKPEFQKLMKVPGIGIILAMIIMLETGDIHRFKKVGNYSSYCRCVNSKRFSNNKQKGQGNRKSGNKYLSWAYMEAANFSIHFNEKAKQYYQKKSAKTKRIVALKALSHKLARACYYVIKNNEELVTDHATTLGDSGFVEQTAGRWLGALLTRPPQETFQVSFVEWIT